MFGSYGYEANSKLIWKPSTAELDIVYAAAMFQ
jgi:hypothetical protein